MSSSPFKLRYRSCLKAFVPCVLSITFYALYRSSQLLSETSKASVLLRPLENSSKRNNKENSNLGCSNNNVTEQIICNSTTAYINHNCEGNDRNLDDIHDDMFATKNNQTNSIQLFDEQERQQLHDIEQPQPLCDRNQILDGNWLPTTLTKPPYITRTVHLRCYPMETYKNKGKKRMMERMQDNEEDADIDDDNPSSLLQSTSPVVVDWPSTYYEWHPKKSNECKFLKWDKGKFCNLMKRSTIMIVGDSLSWEHYSSLAQMLGLRVSQLDQHKSKEEQKNIIKYACSESNQMRLVYRRDDVLSNLTDAIKETFPQVLILNRGAHYVNDTQLLLGIKQNIDEIKEWKGKCHRLGMKCHLFWRTSVPGHPKCSDDAYRNLFMKPNNDLQAMEAWIADKSNYNNYTITYHWYDYKHQNELVLEELRLAGLDEDRSTTIVSPSSTPFSSENGHEIDDPNENTKTSNNVAISTSIGNTRNGDYDNNSNTTTIPFTTNPNVQVSFDILDAYHLNIRRPDDHRAHQNDCLHNCYPGKMDVYNQLLLHFLKRRRTINDAKNLMHLFDEYYKDTTKG